MTCAFYFRVDWRPRVSHHVYSTPTSVISFGDKDKCRAIYAPMHSLSSE